MKAHRDWPPPPQPPPKTDPMQPNHATAPRHARDVADDATRTPSQRNLARAWIELRGRVVANGTNALGRIDAMLDELGDEKKAVSR